MRHINITLKFEVTHSDIAYIITDALESNPEWIVCHTGDYYLDSFWYDGGKLEITFEDFDDPFVIDYDDIAVALQELANRWPSTASALVNGEYDVYDALLLLQLACFREVVYG